MLKTIGFVALTVFGLSSAAYAGCLGAGLGDGCIGVPTPEHRQVYEGPRYHHDHVIIEHRHRRPVIIEHHHYDDED